MAETEDATVDRLLPMIRQAEGSGDSAVSPAGAVGRYQLMPSTARSLGFDPSRLKDPDYNEQAARAAIKDLIGQHGQDDKAILAGYNALPSAVARWKAAGRDDTVLPKETQNYFKRAGLKEAPTTPDIPQGLPTAEEAFGGLPTAEEAFGPPGWQERAAASVDRITKAFGVGIQAGFGEEPIATPSTAFSKETEDALKKYGVWNDYAKGRANFASAVLEGVMRPAAAALALGQRAIGAAAGGVAEATGQAIEETGAAPKGYLTGAGGLRQAVSDPSLLMAFPIHGPEQPFSAARAKGVIGEGEAGHFEAVPLTPENAQARAEAAKEAGVAEKPPLEPAPDVHTLARRIDPEAFATTKPTAEEVQKQNAAYQQAADLMPRTGPAEAPQFNPAIEVAKTEREAEETASARVSAQNGLPNWIKTKADLDAYDAQQKATQEQATVAGKPVGYGNLKPIEGTGDTITRKLAEGVEAKAVEEGITDQFGDLPEYQQVSMADQAAKAGQLLGEDYERAKAVAMGQRQPPKGVLPESVFVAVEKRALAEGDVETLRQLATNSKLTTAATTMGQRIRTLGERDPTSPVGAFQEVQAAREADLARRNATAKEDTINDIKTELKRSAGNASAWSDFINAITCEGE